MVFVKKYGPILLIACGLIAIGFGVISLLRPDRPQRDVHARDAYIQKNIVMDAYDFKRGLEVIAHRMSDASFDKDHIKEALDDLLATAVNANTYFAYLAWIDQQGSMPRVGAKAEHSPIGGGFSYQNTVTKGRYTVTNADELVEAVEKARAGQVIFVASDAKIDLSSYMIAENYVIELNAGVTLASDRGHDDSTGGLIYSSVVRSRPMIIANDDVRITGIAIQGADPYERSYMIPTKGVGVSIVGENVTVDNCEISGFGYAAIEILQGNEHHIVHNLIHHNRSPQGGYGIWVDAADVWIGHNLFHHNRYSVYGTGAPGCSVVFTHNIQMDEPGVATVKMDAQRNTQKVEDGYLAILHNTFLHKNHAVVVHAQPVRGLSITDNHFGQSERNAVNMEFVQNTDPMVDHVEHKDNQYDLLEKLPPLSDGAAFIDEHTTTMQFHPVVSRILYGDIESAYRTTLALAEYIRSDEPDVQMMYSMLQDAVNRMEQYGRAIDFLDNPNITIDGQIYGAVPDDYPIGGGYGFAPVYTTGDHVVHTVSQLVKALEQAKEGEVIYICGDAVLDLTTLRQTLHIPDGVTLASNRGVDHSAGALIFTDAFFSPMFTTGENVTIRGLSIRGADPYQRIDFHRRSFSGPDARGSQYYYSIAPLVGIRTVSPGLTVQNCEIAGFSHAAIHIRGGIDHLVSHSFLHHNQRNGLGYGVMINKAYVTIEYNLMNFNRHDIAGTGVPESGYIARHNIQMGESLSHCFDMHGGRDRSDGSNIAGERILMYNNVFLSDRLPYYIRGVPTDIQDFYHNIIYPPLQAFNKDRLYGTTEEEKEKIFIRDNVFNAKERPTVVP